MSNFGDFVSNANQSGGGNLFTGILMLVFFVLSLTLTALVGSWEVAILASAFISMVIAILLLYMGLTSMTFVGIFVGIIIATIMYLIWSNKYD
jgi:hypothetical protein